MTALLSAVAPAIAFNWGAAGMSAVAMLVVAAVAAYLVHKVNWGDFRFERHVTILAAVILALAVYAGCANAAPLQLAFTATGDDARIGTASAYRVLADTDSTFSAPILLASPTPKPSGQTMTVAVDVSGSVYLCVEAIDDVGLSSRSNVIRWVAPAPPDSTRPGAPRVTITGQEP